MKLIKIKLYIYQLIYSQIKHTKLMTQNMRSPGNGFLGNIAKELMIIFNEFVYNDSITKLNVKKNDNVIEIGSGNGQGIEKLLNLTSKNIISIEEIRWIVMMALWNNGKENDYLFVEDALYAKDSLVIH